MRSSLELLKTSTILALAATLAACASPAGDEQTGSSDDELTRVCGAATNGPVQGYDVSVYQGDFSWTTHKVPFGAARISDGTGSIDSKFDENWANMKSSGVLRAAYQFFEPGENEVTQANLVISKVHMLGAGDLPVMLDVEVTGGQSPTTIRTKAQHWLDLVEAGTGKRPFVYSYASFLETNLGSGFGKYPLWIAGYGVTCPSVPNGWTNWVVWQYSDGSGSLDHDVFNGSLATLTSKYGSALVPPEVDGGEKSDGGEKPDASEPGEKSDAGNLPSEARDGGDLGPASAPPSEISASGDASDGGGCNAAHSSSRSSESFLLFGFVAAAIATMRRRTHK
ncbi:MAG: GH25 family lysozyme [Polyangiaceae bacterium]